MPRYVYLCEACLSEFEAYHSIGDDPPNCEVCGERELIRVPSFSHIVKKSNVGKAVDGAIEEAREDLQQMKDELRKKR